MSSDRSIAISGQPVNAGANQKMRAQLLRQAEQFVDVALPIPDVDTAARIVASNSVDWRMFSSQRMLSFFSIGTRVGLILRFRAFAP